MGLPLILMLFAIIIVGGLSVCGSAGFDIRSLTSAFVLLHLNLVTPDCGSHGTMAPSQIFQQSGFGWKRHRMLIAQPPKDAFHNLSPIYTSPTKVRHSKKAFAPSMSYSKYPAHPLSPTIISMPAPPPEVSPLGSSLKKRAAPPPSLLSALPPPPPNKGTYMYFF
ncbi:hypothetical protein U1Q18_026888 [Sarracenia purpurea var. burkii]